MTQEEKQLLLRDLCARLYTGTIVNYNDLEGCDYELSIRTLSNFPEESLKCYLRPMSSMTEEEKEEFDKVLKSCNNKVFACPDKERRYNFFDAEQEDFMNAHHFDYRGLIPMGLALEAKDGMY